MSNSLSTRINMQFSETLTDSLGSWAVPLLDLSRLLTSGTSADQMDVVYANAGTIASSGSPSSLDLYGSLKQVNGTNADFVKVCLLVIQNTGSVPIIVGAGAACVSTIFADVSDKINIPVNGVLVLMATSTNAYGITATTADILQLAIASGAGSYNILIAGRSA